MLDITPLSLGVETLQNRMTTIIPRNTVIPTSKIKIFTTDTDYQDNVQIKIFEGERQLTKDNYHIDTFELSGFEKGPRGYPTIKIIFKVDINGMLHVTASEKKSNAENSIIINSTFGSRNKLSQDEINSLINEANENEQYDLMYSQKIETIYNIKSICNAVTINVNDKEFNIKSTEKKIIINDVSKIIKWLEDSHLYDLDTLKQKHEYLQKKYLQLVVCINKHETNFTDRCLNTTAADIYGDDENTVFNDNETVNTNLDNNNDDIKEYRKMVVNLCDQLIDVIDSSKCNISSEDCCYLKDYLNSVYIWLYTTSIITSIPAL
ncbi:MAG: hypothetical protein EOP45_10175 [Sphingobacteriaceae bacterium]|nr:MAG: hypothetical protein EOP45_10175 [Sphingobacteriaceae bacterium]